MSVLFHSLPHAILNENNETVTDQNKVTEIFNEYFVTIAAEIGLPDPIASSDEALLTHQNHPSATKIRQNMLNYATLTLFIP